MAVEKFRYVPFDLSLDAFADAQIETHINDDATVQVWEDVQDMLRNTRRYTSLAIWLAVKDKMDPSTTNAFAEQFKQNAGDAFHPDDKMPLRHRVEMTLREQQFSRHIVESVQHPPQTQHSLDHITSRPIAADTRRTSNYFWGEQPAEAESHAAGQRHAITSSAS